MGYQLKEFQCLICGHQFEELIDPYKPLPPCPKCGENVEEILGVPSHSKHSSSSTWRMGHGS